MQQASAETHSVNLYFIYLVLAIYKAKHITEPLGRHHVLSLPVLQILQ